MQLASRCDDFHPSLIPALCAAAAQAGHPAVSKQACSVAVAALISKPDPAGGLPPQQEAALMLAHVQAIAACLEAAPAGGSSSEALLGELISAVNLVAKRLKLAGWAKMAGGDQVSGCRLSMAQLSQHVSHLVPTALPLPLML